MSRSHSDIALTVLPSTHSRTNVERAKPSTDVNVAVAPARLFTPAIRAAVPEVAVPPPPQLITAEDFNRDFDPAPNYDRSSVFNRF